MAPAVAIERVGALQAQWPPSPYVALWSRVEGFERRHLVQALERRRALKSTLMRQTLHIVSARDYLAYAGLFHDDTIERFGKRLERRDVAVDIGALAEQAVAHTTEAPRSRPDLLAFLGQRTPRAEDERPWLVWSLLQAHAALVHAPASATWRTALGRSSFVPAQAWLGRRPDRGDDAAEHLVRRYLAAFGPASRADFGQWTGLPVTRWSTAFERVAPTLRRFRDEGGRELFDLPRAPLPHSETPAPVRFLPMWDSILLAHADRTRVLPEAFRKMVIRVNGDVQQTFLVDGFVAGMWSVAVAGGRATLLLTPFVPIETAARDSLVAEGERLARFVEPGASAHAVRFD